MSNIHNLTRINANIQIDAFFFLFGNLIIATGGNQI